MKRSTFKMAAVAAGTVALVAALAACAPAAQEPAAAPSGGESDAPAAAAPAETPEPDSFGVVVAESWKDIYPNEYQTYMANESNSPQGKQDYLTEYPELVTMYAGYGFAKGYDEAAGHPYSLQSVAETPRVNENTLANCITCKTPQYTAMVNSEGDSAYQKPFAEVLMQMTEPISCYNCHENDPTKTTVTQKFFVNSMGADADKVSTDSQVCGQCHNEYYFAPETKATTNPYTGLEGMTAEAILAYYDEMGFKDWEHTETGAHHAQGPASRVRDHLRRRAVLHGQAGLHLRRLPHGPRQGRGWHRVQLSQPGEPHRGSGHHGEVRGLPRRPARADRPVAEGDHRPRARAGGQAGRLHQDPGRAEGLPG